MGQMGPGNLKINPEQNGAILIDGCPLAKYLRKGFVPDTVGTSTPLAQSATSLL
jgi:hypothetical protein